MKRMLAGVVLATTATLVAATPAMAAAPKNPVVTVKKQLAPGKGVKFTERTTLDVDGQRDIFVRRSGTLQFSKSGVAASDITGKFNISLKDLGADADDAPELLKALATPERTIRVGTTAYLSGGMWSTLLPEGKTWFKMPKGPTGGVTGVYGQPLNLAEPATLKTLFKGAKPAGGGYAGKITVGALWKVSPWYRAAALSKPSAKAQKSTISWRITVNSAGLPTRLVSTFPVAALSTGKGTVSVDTRFSGWGTAVSIKAPPVDEVATEFENGEDDASIIWDQFGNVGG
ncbi:hypothetical protein ETD86_37585 [Nonomuraea turkmeniaca]|uniref:Uncharacterized protein n=1 Tax=Nonomuraea turkmeniaca TaxID=103838 RepID=A0A5S4F446_9ACTN|nr:hypothetical protein [Nonomuraea turkmeniaca]TMR10931.1 hypothetical protein ETD86_37585 [Nonomuraea turkmeniaca]